MKSLITVKRISVPAPSGDDRRAEDQRIRDALAVEPLEIPLPVLRSIPSRVGQELSCIVGRVRHGYTLIDVSSESSCSVALDIGTTNIVASLYDNVSHEIISRTKVENPQGVFGSDILTRLQHAMMGNYDPLRKGLMEGVHAAIQKLCDESGVNSCDIHALAAAGNTVMSHFFLGLDVSRIPVAPFVPVVRKPGFYRASDLHLPVHPEALVYVFPNAGSYVGGDIIAGILASGMYAADDTCVLIDAGTNAEVVIGNRDWMLVGAGAAGPALEEGIARIGRKAEKGIIYDVRINQEEVECKTFDNAPPEGICGSGMISLIYEMYCAGIIGNGGMLNPADKRVKKVNGVLSFELSGDSGGGLVIGQTEIDNFLRSKAAMFTLLLVLLRSVGLKFSDVQKVYVAGALGNGIDVKKAAGMGMLPDWPDDRIIPLGNASLRGAEMVLDDCSLLDLEDRIIDGITYKHMHDDPEFMKEFQGALFIPHTNPDMLAGR